MAVISDNNPVKREFLLPGEIISLLTSLIALPIIAVFFYQRLCWHLNRTTNKRMTVASGTLLLSYVTSFLFILTLTAVLHVRMDGSIGLCDASIVLCLTLYVLTKAAGFLFLIERAYIISWPVNPRHRTPEYVLSCIGIFVPYLVVTILCLKYRFVYYTGKDVCILGLRIYALVPLIGVEVLSYLYLTLRFLIPLVMVHHDGNGLLSPLRRVVLRTFIGTAITTLSTLAVKVSLTLFNGEPAWLCCMTCKIDAVIACVVLHWITQPESPAEEHGTAQALGIGFEKSIPQDSDSNRTVSGSPREMDLKDIL